MFQVLESGNAKHTIVLSNSIIGASILSMPFCFKQCGIILGSIILYLNSCLTKLCCHQLIKASLIARRRNYEVLAYDVMGPLGKLWVEICIIGYLMGCCIAYLVVLGDLGPEILDKMGLNYSLQSSRILLMAGISLLVILPLSLLRDIEILNVMSTISVGIYLLLVLKSFYEVGYQGITHGISSNIELWKFSGVFQCVPIFSMALSCQTQVFEVYESLPEPSLKTMDRVVSSAIDLCTFIYLSVGIAGYLAFADTNFTGNILISFAPSLMTDLIKAGFLISIILSFPLCVLPCRTSLNSLLYGRTTTFQPLETSVGSPGPAVHSSTFSGLRFKFLTALIVVSTLIVGICIPNVEFILGLVGATLGTAVCSVAPAWIYLQVAPSTSNERWIAKVVLVCGIVILILGSAANILAEEAYSETHVDPAAVPLNLKELDAKYNSVKQLSPVEEDQNNNNQEMIGDNSLQDLLSKNSSGKKRRKRSSFKRFNSTDRRRDSTSNY